MESNLNAMNILTVYLLCAVTGCVPNSDIFTVAEQNESYLIREVLLKNYDLAVRPVSDPRQPLTVNITIGIKGFIELDMKKQTMTSFGWLAVTWFDAFLKWNVSQFPIDAVFLPGETVWRPGLVVFNTLNQLDELEARVMKVRVGSDGLVLWYAGGLFKTFCSIDISYYPLDTQSCSIEVMSWSLNELVLLSRFGDPAIDVSLMETHPEWALVGTDHQYVPRSGDFKVLRYTFTLKRKVLFYVVNIILPILLLSLMNCLVFLLPVDSGEKMMVSVSVFLSFAVFMSFINDSLPRNSDSLCLFSVYVAVQMFLSACSIAMAAVIVFIFSKAKNEAKDDESANHASSPSDGSVKGSSLSVSLTASRSVSEPAPEFPSSMTSTTEPTTDAAPAALANGTTPAPSTGYKTSCAGTRGCLGRSVATVREFWRMVKRAHDGSAEDMRNVSRALDKFCFVLTIFLNVFSGGVFVAIMASSWAYSGSWTRL